MTIKDKTNPIKDLQHIFQNKILSLLQEYFYGDWGKIPLVIGDKFVNRKEEDVSFMSSNYDNDDLADYQSKSIYTFTEANSWTLENFKSICV